jgi:hypothetical protein
VTAEEGAKGLLGYGGINSDGTVRHAAEDGSKGRRMMRDGGGSGVAIHEGINRLRGQLERRMHGWARCCRRNAARVARCLATVGLRRPWARCSGL